MKATNAKKSVQPSLLAQLQGRIKNYLDQPRPMLITDAILQDHQAMKDLLKLLKKEDEPVAQKKTAFKLFKSLLTSHTEIEEKVVYALSKHIPDLKRKTHEGLVEHDVHKMLLHKIKTPNSRPRLEHWLAQTQVLAELVEHHLKEEERDLLPQLKRELSLEQQTKAAAEFLKLREKTQRTQRPRNRGALKKSPRK